jgi:hypothetical protein
MSNIAGKVYAINTITPIKWYLAWVNRFIFWLAGSKFVKRKLDGLLTLSLIHYARWVIIGRKDFPRLDPRQPEEDPVYAYEFFFSNFNGSWEQYIDSFSMSIPGGLDLFWFQNVGYPKSVPIKAFHDYIIFNQIWTDHVYNAYPMAASNDVKAAKRVRDELLRLIGQPEDAATHSFEKAYDAMILKLQGDLSQMAPAPIISLANQAARERKRIQKLGGVKLLRERNQY